MKQPVNILTDQLINYTLHLADNALIIGHRCSEWCGHGPILEQDIALSNMALDYIGQARNFYQYAATLIGGEATEDSLAYLRDEREFKNLLLTEMPNGDWAQTILRQFFFSTHQYYLYARLQQSSDVQLAAIAEKSLKEVTYHLRWSSEWVIRLGDGTEESKQRLLNALDELWMFTGELFEMAD
ncbi:MAG TPA: 1,2-phenylacetyl-CoA epoxidase subunit PaaC, partial [Chitinophagaceae bacterium]|nr:1,2-phenylacetyl-CoA epoxidase subunit PaaC [Chitinophagaceae bacterium]